MSLSSSASAASASDDPRPTIFKFGVGLLVLHELIVIGLCAFGGVLGAFGILFGSLQESASGQIGWMVLFGGLAALFLMVGVFLAFASIAVCAMAWSGSRFWLQALIVTALINCVVVMPNPIGILAGVLCVLGSLEYLNNQAASAPDSPTELDSED